MIVKLEHRPLAAFGSVLFLCRMPAGSYRDIEITNNQGLYEVGYYFFTKGRARPWIIQTGQVLEDRVAGWLNLEHPGTSSVTAGTLRTEYLEDTEWLCMPYKLNSCWPNSLSSLVLSAGSSHSLDIGSNLYLGRGSVLIGNKEFQGPVQIRIRSNPVDIVAISDVYGLIFP